MQMHRKNWNQTRTRPRKNLGPTLRFSPWAWAKLLFLRDLGPTEVGGFAISDAQDLLYLEDFVLIRQECSPVTVAFDDDAVAEFFDAQIDAGRRPAQFGRVWVHSHPGTSATPSRVDEETFARVFERCDWAVMAILAQGGQTFARLQFHTGPGGSLKIPVAVDWSRPFAASDWPGWNQEYLQNVRRDEFCHHPQFSEHAGPFSVSEMRDGLSDDSQQFFHEKGPM